MSNDSTIAGTYATSPASGYAGDVTPATAWKILSERSDAALIDVRTRAEALEAIDPDELVRLRAPGGRRFHTRAAPLKALKTVNALSGRASQRRRFGTGAPLGVLDGAER